MPNLPSKTQLNQLAERVTRLEQLVVILIRLYDSRSFVQVNAAQQALDVMLNKELRESDLGQQAEKIAREIQSEESTGKPT